MSFVLNTLSAYEEEEDTEEGKGQAGQGGGNSISGEARADEGRLCPSFSSTVFSASSYASPNRDITSRSTTRVDK